MPGSNPPTHSKLDAELERLFDQEEGQSIKSCLKIITSPSTDPTELTRTDLRVESSKLLQGLLRRETEAIQGYYAWRIIADRVSQVLRMARQQARGYRRRRAFKTGMREVERRYSERNKKPGR